MIKSLIGFVVLVLGGWIGYISKSMVTQEADQMTSIQIEPIEFIASGAGFPRSGGGGSCGG